MMTRQKFENFFCRLSEVKKYMFGDMYCQ